MRGADRRCRAWRLLLGAVLVVVLLAGCGWHERFGLPRQTDARNQQFVNWALGEVLAMEPEASLVELEAHRHVLFVTLRRPGQDVRYRAEPQLPVAFEGAVPRRGDLLPFAPGLIPRQLIEKLPNEYAKQVRCPRSASQVRVTGTFSGVTLLRATCEGYRDAPVLNAIGTALIEPVASLDEGLAELLVELAALAPAVGTNELVISANPLAGGCSLTTRFVAELPTAGAPPSRKVVWQQRRCNGSDNLLAAGFAGSADAASLTAGSFRLTGLDAAVLIGLLHGRPPQVSATQLRVVWSVPHAAPIVEVVRSGQLARYTTAGQPV